MRGWEGAESVPQALVIRALERVPVGLRIRPRHDRSRQPPTWGWGGIGGRGGDQTLTESDARWAYPRTQHSELDGKGYQGKTHPIVRPSGSPARSVAGPHGTARGTTGRESTAHHPWGFSMQGILYLGDFLLSTAIITRRYPSLGRLSDVE